MPLPSDDDDPWRTDDASSVVNDSRDDLSACTHPYPVASDDDDLNDDSQSDDDDSGTYCPSHDGAVAMGITLNHSVPFEPSENRDDLVAIGNPWPRSRCAGSNVPYDVDTHSSGSDDSVQLLPPLTHRPASSPSLDSDEVTESSSNSYSIRDSFLTQT